MFDQVPFAGPGIGIAIRTSANFVQALYIDGVQGYLNQYDVQVVRGQNIHVEHAGLVRAESTADGKVYVGANVPYSDARSTPQTYPTNYPGTWSPAFNGSGSVLGNGTLTGKYTLNGNVCTANVSLTLGNTTVMGTSAGFSLGLPAVELHAGSAVAVHAGAIWSMAVYAGGSTILVGNNGVYLGPTVPFTWASGDTLSITVTYRIA